MLRMRCTLSPEGLDLLLAYLSKMKHISGDFNRWITRFEDRMETCETIGVELSEEAKMFYFMNNLNDTIFGGVKSKYMDLSKRALFPDT